jgi:hypothetical protein
MDSSFAKQASQVQPSLHTRPVDLLHSMQPKSEPRFVPLTAVLTLLHPSSPVTDCCRPYIPVDVSHTLLTNNPFQFKDHQASAKIIDLPQKTSYTCTTAKGHGTHIPQPYHAES